MKKIEQLLLTSCGFTVLMASILYFLGALVGVENNGMPFGSFALTFVFGVMISLANLVLKYDKLTKWIRIAIHYSVLMLAFCILFVGSGKITNGTQGSFFAAVVVFTFLYALVFICTYFATKLMRRADRKIDKRIADKNKNKVAEPVKKYEKRYQ
jgi:uncharacterized membrane protein